VLAIQVFVDDHKEYVSYKTFNASAAGRASRRATIGGHLGHLPLRKFQNIA